jgi:hypothetical protein
MKESEGGIGKIAKIAEIGKQAILGFLCNSVNDDSKKKSAIR